MDKSLDEIIASERKTGRRSGGRRRSARVSARAQVLGRPPLTSARRARAIMAEETRAENKAEKIIVSNLPPDVNEKQIQEFFMQTVGDVKDVLLSYDPTGRSKGIATVNFIEKGDGNKAYQSYNNRLIDGKRPMRIELVVDPSEPLPLVSRVSPAAAKVAAKVAKVAAAGAAAARAGRRRRGSRKTERPNKTAADLDAEMEDYTSATVPAGTSISA